MSVAERPEPAPAMQNVNLATYADALAFVQSFDGQAERGLRSLSIPSARSQSSSACASDVALALCKRKPSMPKALLELRIRSLPIKSDQVSAFINHLQRTAQHGATLQPHTDGVSDPITLRHLRINDGEVTMKDLEVLSALLYGHATLSHLALQANCIEPRRRHSMRDFAWAVSLSNLRVLELTNNNIGTRSMCEFLDNLHLPCLSRLYLGMTMQRSHLERDQRENDLWRQNDGRQPVQQTASSLDEDWKQEMHNVTRRLVQLLQPDVSRMPYAPNLEVLMLNGNDLGWPCTKQLAKAVQHGSRRLEELGVFSTLYEDERQLYDSTDSESEERHDVNGAGSHRATRAQPPNRTEDMQRSTSIGTFMRSQRSSARTIAPQAQDESIDRPNRTMTPTRNGHGEATRTNRTKEERITIHSWRKILDKRLSANDDASLKVKDASRRLLPVLRVLTCKSHACDTESDLVQGRENAIFPFARLPAEVRQEIVMHLDDRHALSHEQMQRIISFASDPSTIGYGQKSEKLGLSAAAINAIQREADDGDGDLENTKGSTSSYERQYGLLLHRPFRWSDMIAAHSVPRDWLATVWDQIKNRKSASASTQLVLRRDVAPQRHERANDQAGIADIDSSYESSVSTYDFEPYPKVSAAHRIWLDEQPGLHAFWEATGTLASERD